MNALYIAVICIGGGPFCAAIDQAKPELPVPEVQEETTVSTEEWETVEVAQTKIELPKREPAEYQRTAPTNYVMPTPTKTERLWCPQHGYSCGMQRSVEDLAGHLQSVHGQSLEFLNEIGRGEWQSLHNDLHWAKETDERKQLYLNPQPTKSQPAASQCGPGGCPSGTCPTYSRRGLGIF